MFYIMHGDGMEQPMGESNSINPTHYNKHSIQPIYVIEDWELPYHLGNVLKYICRYKDKNGIEDLQKARWYLDRFIENQREESRGK